MGIIRTLLITGMTITVLASQVSAAIPVQVEKGETAFGYTYRVMKTDPATRPYQFRDADGVLINVPQNAGDGRNFSIHDFYGAYGISKKVTLAIEYNKYGAKFFDKTWPITRPLQGGGIGNTTMHDTVEHKLDMFDIYAKYALSNNIALSTGFRKYKDVHEHEAVLGGDFVWAATGSNTYVETITNVDKKYIFGGLALNFNVTPKTAVFADYKMTGDWREYVAGVSYFHNKDIYVDLSYKDFKYDKNNYKTHWKGFGLGLTWKFTS